MDEVAKGQNLDDFLINLAEGLSKAQSRLSRYPVINALGQQSLVYHIPKMEFELKLQMTATEPAAAPRAAATDRAVRLPVTKLPRLNFTPVRAGQQGSSESATSIIKGVMVATPVDSSTAQVQLSITVKKSGARKCAVQIIAIPAPGTSVEGGVVEVNVDRDLSQQLNIQQRRRALKQGTRLEQARLSLNEQGQAETALVISNQEPNGQIIALSADFSGQTQTLLYRFEHG